MGQFSPKFWYQNSPISAGLNWPPKQYHSGLTRFGPIFWAKLALFILQYTGVGILRGQWHIPWLHKLTQVSPPLHPWALHMLNFGK